MSVLLDALKKAALEKQKRENLSSDVPCVGNSFVTPDEPALDKNPSLQETPIDASSKKSHLQQSHLQQEKSDPSEEYDFEAPGESSITNRLELVDSFSITEIDGDSIEKIASQEKDGLSLYLEVEDERDLDSNIDSSPKVDKDEIEMIVDLDPHIIEQVDIEHETSQDNGPYQGSQSDSTQTSTSGEMSRSKIDQEKAPQLENTQNIENPSIDNDSARNERKADDGVDQNATTANKISDEDLKALLSNVAIDDDLVNQIENTQDAVQDQRRVSFQRLLDKNREEAKKRKLRFLMLYALVIVVAAVVVALYFFYVNNQSANVLPVQPRSYIEISEPDSIDQDGVADANTLGQVQAVPDVLGQNDMNSDAANAIGQTKEEDIALAEAPIASNSLASPSATVHVDRKTEYPSRPQKPATNSPSKQTSTTPIVAANDAQIIKSSIVPQVGGNRQNQSVAVDNTVQPNNIITKGRAKPRPAGLNLSTAYEAYQQGDFAKAEEYYRRALNADPYHRDALLGSAAVAVAQQNYQAAIGFYQAQLNRRPDDDVANAGMLALAAVDGTTPEILSKVNQLLTDNPNAAHLHFLKGSLFARQQQWDAAQQSFFSAWSIEPERADYTYNLAIALDHLRQYAQALRFYRQSLQLPNINISPLQRKQLNHRISQLEMLDE